jgi:hypothetical protein
VLFVIDFVTQYVPQAGAVTPLDEAPFQTFPGGLLLLFKALAAKRRIALALDLYCNSLHYVEF